MRLIKAFFIVLPLIAVVAVTGCSSKITYATIETNLGTFKFELFTKDAPKTCENFISLTNKGYYDQTSTNKVIFHRIIQTFMIQTGDPTGTGAGGPGYTFADELPPKRPYDPGIVAMANSGPDTNGSQFFICTGSDASSLNSTPEYTQFGRIVSGMDVVQKIAAVPVVNNGAGEISKPVDPPYIIKVTIEKA